MTPEEAKADVDRRLSEHGWAAQIGRAGYEKISRFAEGNEAGLRQLCSKMIAFGALQGRQEITEDLVDMALADLERPEQLATAEIDLPSIDELAAKLEAKVAAGEVSTEVRFPEPRIRPAAKRTPVPRPKLLLVDPVEATRERFGQALAQDFTVIEAGDGEQGWRRLVEQADIQLIVTELALPGTNGYAFVRQVREATTPPHVAEVPIIVLTAPEHADAKLRALKSGANDFLTKDSNPRDVRTRALARHKASRATAEMTRAPRAAQRTERYWSTHSKAGAATALRAEEASRPARGAPVSTLTAERRYTGDGKSMPRLAATVGDGVARPPRSNATAITVTATVLLGVAIVAIYMARNGGEFWPMEAPIVARSAPVTAGEETTPEAPGADSGPAKNAASDDTAASEGSPPVEPQAEPDTSGKATMRPDPGGDAVRSTSSFAKKLPRAEVGGAKPLEPKPIEPKIAQPDAIERQPTEPTGSESAADTADADVARRAGDAEVGSAKPIGPTPPNESPAAPQGTANAMAKAPDAAVPAAKPAPEVGQRSETPAVESSTPDVKRAPPKTAEPVVPSPAPNPPPSIESAESGKSGGSRENIALANREAAPVAPAPSPTAPEAAPAPPPRNRISQGELQSFLTRFASVYEAGDLDQFMGLFSDNARTNDRTNLQGIRLDYQSLFRTTDLRQMKLGEINWELNGSEAQGWGEFDVRVRRRGEQQPYRYTGSLTFVLHKVDGRLQIERLYHGQRRADLR